MTATKEKLSEGRHFLSVWASRIFEITGIKRLFGINLVAAIFVTIFVSPQVDALAVRSSIEQHVVSNPIEATAHTQTTFELPLASFHLSQGYHFWHPGIDMTAPSGTPIYAIDEGSVEYIESSYFGYGKHVIVAHPHNVKSLYAHMSEIKTVVGRKVARGELIGRVGSTGWSTGNHLHLEIYQKGAPINPLEVLPLRKEEIAYDPIYNQTLTPPQSASNSAQPVTSTASAYATAPTATSILTGSTAGISATTSLPQ